MIYSKRLKVGKTERYSLGVSDWLNGEQITSANVVCGNKISTGAVDFQNGVVGFLATGLSVGRCSVVFNYTTATRSDSDLHEIDVIAADSIEGA